MDNIIIFCAKYLVALPVLIFIWVWLKQSKDHKIQLAAAIIAAGIIAVIIDKITGKLYFDPRPFVSQHVKPLITHAADNGFPSEHTILATTLAGVLYFYSRRLSIATLVLAIIIGSARVAAHVHSPIDIIGGLAIGLIAAWLGQQLSRKFAKVPVSKTKKAN